MTPHIRGAPLRPSVTFATASLTPDPGTFADNDDDSEASTAAAADDDDEDDANPTQTTRMNPLQLLNQAMEHGVRSTARQYRRNQASYQRNLQESMAAGGPESEPRRGRPSMASVDGRVRVCHKCTGEP